MSRRGLNVAEALALFEELPSDPESAFSDEESDDADYQPNSHTDELNLISSDDDGNISDAEIDDINLPGPSQPRNVTWKKHCQIKKSIPEFDEEAGPSEEIKNMEDQTPIGLFLALFPIIFMENVVFQSNLYATQTGKPYSPLTLEEFYKFLGINILMGIKKLPSYRDFWSSNELLHDNYVSEQMPVKRFSWILSHFHLNDNTLQPNRSADNYDKLYKVRPLINLLSEKFKSVFRPNKTQAIDESMVRFKGRSSLKQYMPKKPIKRGYKIWMRCDESGFACQFDLYTGKLKEVERNLGERVVKTLCEDLFGKNHTVFMDNYFTSYELFRFLETQNVYCCGTVNLTRKNLPKKLMEDKKMKRGEFDYAVSNDNIVCVKWKDKRCVSLLSTLENPITKVTVERKEKDGSKVQVNCPKIVVDYNKNMGFVDYFDQLKSCYEIDRKSHKWWHRIFFHFLDVVVVNAFILYKMLPDVETEFTNMKMFRMEVVRCLIMMGNTDTLPKKRLSKDSKPVAIKRHRFHVPDEKRFQNVQHIAVKCKPRRCAFCSTTEKPHRTRWMCQTCNVGLCMYQTDISCFQKFHQK